MTKRRGEHSKSQAKLRVHARVTRAARAYGAVDFFNTLAGPFRERVDVLSPAHRERLYPPTVTLSMFVSQALHADHSCQRVVNEWATMRAVEGLPLQSVRTGGYCRARQRLPVTMIRTLAQETGEHLCRQSALHWRWQGRCVKLIDGTGISMPDTPLNQSCYPQLSSQAVGVGFPLARLLAVICLSTGGVLDAAIGPFEGKGHGEHGLLRGLLNAFQTGDVVLGDALYSSYWLLAALQSAGADGVFTQHAGRRTDFRRGHRLGKHDHIVTWNRPRQAPVWMSKEAYAAFPPSLTMREARCGHLTLVTTMLDPQQVSPRALGELYKQRWHVELDLRAIKTILGMEVFRCQTPEMVEKELWTYLLAYNLIRVLMAEAAGRSSLHPRDISFKHTVQMTLSWLSLRRPSRKPTDISTLCTMIAQCLVGKRPGRVEPRARKRRPKSFPWLKVPRPVAREQARQTGYGSAAK